MTARPPLPRARSARPAEAALAVGAANPGLAGGARATRAGVGYVARLDARTRPAMMRPWLQAALGGAGLSLGGAGAFALFASSAQLARAAALGDARLAAILGASFCAGLALCRAFLYRRKLPEERIDEGRAEPRHLR